jgi:hypothetical protein
MFVILIIGVDVSKLCFFASDAEVSYARGFFPAFRAGALGWDMALPTNLKIVGNVG